MCPIFKESAFSPLPPCRTIQERSVVKPEAREGGQVMGTGQDVHAVDLVKSEPGDGASQVEIIDSNRSRCAESLGRQGDASGVGNAQVVSSSFALQSVGSQTCAPRTGI